MPASPVQSNSGAQNTGLATVSATLLSPATAGNVIVLHVAADDYAATPPTGLTQSTGCKQETFLGHYLWWKVAAGGETSVSYTIGSASPSCWIIEEISGLEASPYDISAGQLAASSGTNYTTPTVIPTAGERFLVGSIGGSLGSAGMTTMATWLNSFTEVADTWTTLASGTRDSQGAATLQVTADGVTGYSTGATWDAAATPQARTGIIIAFKVAAGGATAHTRTQTDTVGLTDAATTAATFARAQTDATGITDAATPVAAYARVQTDLAGLTDTVTAQLNPGGVAHTRTVDDTIGLTDTGDPLRLDVAETVTDLIGLTDTTAVVSAFVRPVTDLAGLTDTTSVTTVGAGIRQVDDNIGLTDTATTVAAYNRAQTDTTGLADTVLVQVAYTVTVTDTVGLADATTTQVAGAGTRQVDDSTGLIDAVTVAVAYTRSVDDTAGLVDAALATTPQITIADLLGLTDSVVPVLTAVRVVTDTIGLADTTSTGALVIPGALTVTGDRLRATVTGDRIRMGVS